MKKLPLADFHAVNGAHFMDQSFWSIPLHYGDTAQEIHLIQTSAGLVDRTYLAKILLSGNDAVELINRISTNDMNELLAGSVCDTIFSTPRGKIMDYCRVLNLGDGYLVVSNFMDRYHLYDWINRFITIEDAETEDVTENFLWFTLIGPKSFEILNDLAPEKFTEKDETIWLEYEGDLFSAFKNDNYYTTAYDICLTDYHQLSTMDWLLQKIKSVNGGLVGEEAFQVVRIESGMPCWKNELSNEYNPYEARLIKAVSFTKGAYTGQETISWIDTHGEVQRYLMILEMKDKPNHRPPLKVMFNNDPIGTLTSCTYDPLAKKHVGLAYIDRAYTVDGLNLNVELDNGSDKIIAGLRPPNRRI